MGKVYGVIYKITNTITGKVYIGQTIRKNYKERVRAHFKKQRAIDLVYKSSLKYGKQNFSSEVIYTAFDKDSLNLAEKHLIMAHNSRTPSGYNIQYGGDSTGKLDKETISKIKQANRRFYEQNSNPRKGIKFTQEHCSALSKARKGFDSPARKQARIKSVAKRIEKNGIIATHITSQTSTTYATIAECAKFLNLCPCNISRVLRGKNNRTQHKGYTFKYLLKENNQATPKPRKDTYCLNKVNKGGYSVKVRSNYIGWRATLEEAKTLRDNYLKTIDNPIPEDVE